MGLVHPLLIALPLGLISLWFRLQIDESPTFEQTQAMEAATEDDENAPKGALAVMKAHWRPILIAMALVGATNTAGYSLTSYMPSYLETSHHYSTVQAALATIPALVALSIGVPFIGMLSDRISRKPVYAVAIVYPVPCRRSPRWRRRTNWSPPRRRTPTWCWRSCPLRSTSSWSPPVAVPAAAPPSRRPAPERPPHSTRRTPCDAPCDEPADRPAGSSHVRGQCPDARSGLRPASGRRGSRD
ncbi:hypothetical protein GCM10027030_06850 [Luteococcus sediminum]